MLYLNNCNFLGAPTMVPHLTLTSVVFEYDNCSFVFGVSTYLTLTSVVFELLHMVDKLADIFYLTLTSVVFE